MVEAAKQTDEEIDADLIDLMASLSTDPYKFVLKSFEWGEGELANVLGPEEWQADLLKEIRDGLISPSEALKYARSAGNGVGKSAFAAWIILWSISTKEDTRGTVTANTENQLRTKTWPELAKWYRRFIAKDWFVLSDTSIHAKDPEHQKTWRFDRIPWSKTNPEAFAGLHNQGKRVVIIFDEASAIDDVIWDTAEGALTDKDTEIIWLAFGNPTRRSGKFFNIFSDKTLGWNTGHIDSRTVRITNKEQIKKWIESKGEDSDWVKVHVKGEFPASSDLQFIPTPFVDAARGRHVNAAQYNFAAKILVCEPAWTGGDEIVIAIRQGLAFRVLMKLQKNDDDMALAGYLAKFEDEEKADAVFIDFGYGTGVYSAGKSMGRKWRLIEFGGASSDAQYLNKRAEMWGLMKDWLRDGGCIPDDPVMVAELQAPEYYIVATGSNAGKIVLESKEDMKGRGVSSPNRADALALTFAFPVRPKQKETEKTLLFAKRDYDIFK